MNPDVRIFIFFFGMILFSSLEFYVPYRKRNFSRANRWPHNFLIIVLGSFVGKVIFSAGLAAICIYTEKNSIGLLNLVSFSFGFEIVLSIFLLDFFIYIQHWAFHKNKWLWKLHRVHHSDIDLDTTSALRFHPIEILISLAYKAILILILGFSVESVFIFEVILNFMAMFNHSNIYLPFKFEKNIRKLIVTPQMHIIHHSTEQFESDSNYGFNFSIWDRVFNTYTGDFSNSGIIGNRLFRLRKDHSLMKMLLQPFK